MRYCSAVVMLVALLRMPFNRFGVAQCWSASRFESGRPIHGLKLILRWPREKIDYFILAAQEEAGFEPAAEADRRTLIRRASLDLTGLPPSYDQVELFAADSDPLAYEKLIDRLLESPHFGERWSRHWLDVVRYAENSNLPGFLALCPGDPVVVPKLWGNAFLPGKYQGTYIDTRQNTPESMIPHLRNSALSQAEQKRQMDLIGTINQQHLAANANDMALETRINAMELAYRMQFEAMEAFGVWREPQHVRNAYGSSEFAHSCLLARRLTRHGLLDETLVVWGGEFGRTPTLGRRQRTRPQSVWIFDVDGCNDLFPIVNRSSDACGADIGLILLRHILRILSRIL